MASRQVGLVLAVLASCQRTEPAREQGSGSAPVRPAPAPPPAPPVPIDPNAGHHRDITAFAGTAYRVAIGDLDGNGTNEIVLADKQNVRVVDASGNELATTPALGGVQVMVMRPCRPTVALYPSRRSRRRPSFPSSHMLGSDAVLVLVLAGCGRIAFDPVSDGASADVPLVNVVGELDPTFGGTGIVTPSSAATGVAYDVVAHGTDYVVAGTDSPGGATRVLMMAVAQDGSLDPAWGTSGEVFAAPFGATYGYGAAAAADGSVFVMGDGDSGATDDFVVGKLTPAGALDTAFSADGWGSYDPPPMGQTPRAALSS